MAASSKHSPGILHITPFFSPNIGGVETHLDDLVRELDRLGFRNYVQTYSPITTPNVNWRSSEKIGKSVFIIRYRWIGHNLFHRLETKPLLNFFYITPYLFFRTLLWLITHHHQIDIIHSHGLNAALIGNILKRLFHLKTHLVSIYSSYDNIPANSFATKYMVSILNRTDCVLTQSAKSHRQLIALGVKPDKISPYRHWLNLNKFKPLDQRKNLRKKLGLTDKFTVLFIGRMLPIKGAYNLAKIASHFPQISFVFVGTGPDYIKISKLISTNPNITLVGNIPYEKLFLYYNIADLFCLPSLYNEGWGRVVMEALACGVPVLVSNMGAVPEVVDESVAVIIKPTIKNLKQSINHLINNHQLYQKLRNSTRPFAQEHFHHRNINLITKHYH